MTTPADRSRRIRAAAIASLAAELWLSGCSKPVDRSEPVRAVQVRPAAPAPRYIFPENTLPAAYFGQLDKPGGRSERWTICLKPGIYFMRVEFREYSGSSSVDVIGSWDPIVDRAAIRLHTGGRRPIEFDVPHLDTLQFHGIIVRRATDPPPYLVRNTAIQHLEPRVSLTGYMSCLGDAGYFQDCGTAWSLPILMEGDFKRARHKYLDATQVRRSSELDSALARHARSLRSTSRAWPRSPMDLVSASVPMPRLTSPPPRLLVSLDGRIVQRPGINGAPAREWLIIERFGQAMPGEACDVSSSLAIRERREPLTSLPYGIGR